MGGALRHLELAPSIYTHSLSLIQHGASFTFILSLDNEHGKCWHCTGHTSVMGTLWMSVGCMPIACCRIINSPQRGSRLKVCVKVTRDIIVKWEEPILSVGDWLWTRTFHLFYVNITICLPYLLFSKHFTQTRLILTYTESVLQESDKKCASGIR